jgi:hypothetical protein
LKVVVTDDVLADAEWFPFLDILAMLVEARRHIFAAESAPSLLESDWVASRPRSLRDLIRSSTTAESFDTPAHQSILMVDVSCRVGGAVDVATRNTRLRPFDALLFATTPFQIVVENDYYDAAFLFWMARAVGFTKLLEAYRHGRFLFRHAGGKDAIPRSAELFSAGVWARTDGRYHRAYRLWLCALIDSDADYPGHDPNAAIITAAAAHVGFIHKLRKRAIENYLPGAKLRQLRSITSIDRKVDALERLTSEQRLYYHMKEGFRRRGSSHPTKAAFMANREIVAQEKALYVTVADSDWQWLAEGFGSSISDIFVDQRYRSNPGDAAIVDRGDVTEISAIVHEIYSRL